MTCIPMYWSVKRESGRIDGLAVKTGIQNVSMCLLILRMLPLMQNLQLHVPFNKTTWVRASQSRACFSRLVTAGQKSKGKACCWETSKDLMALNLMPSSKVHGYIIGINHTAVVKSGWCNISCRQLWWKTQLIFSYSRCVSGFGPGAISGWNHQPWADAEQWKHAARKHSPPDVNSGLLIAGYNHDKVFCCPHHSLKFFHRAHNLRLAGQRFYLQDRALLTTDK